MYSVILMAALNTTPAMPACHTHRSHGCHGYACHGGCFGRGCFGGCFGGRGCFGGGCYGSAYRYGGSPYYGGYYGDGSMYYPTYGSSPYIIDNRPEGVKMPTPKNPEPPPESRRPRPATIVVNIPADARLHIGDYATTSTSSLRTFQSPELEPNKDFVYVLKAEAVRDGRTVSVTKEVNIRAGETTRVTIDFPATVAQK